MYKEEQNYTFASRGGSRSQESLLEKKLSQIDEELLQDAISMSDFGKYLTHTCEGLTPQPTFPERFHHSQYRPSGLGTEGRLRRCAKKIWSVVES